MPPLLSDGTNPEPAAVAPKIIARANWPFERVDLRSGGKDKHQLVLRNAAELEAAVPQAVRRAALLESLKVKDIDWNKQMLVVASGGTRRTSGYRVDVTGVEAKDKTLTVKWKVVPPNGIAGQAFTHPAEAVLLPKFAGKVVFDPAK